MPGNEQEGQALVPENNVAVRKMLILIEKRTVKKLNLFRIFFHFN